MSTLTIKKNTTNTAYFLEFSNFPNHYIELVENDINNKQTKKIPNRNMGLFGAQFGFENETFDRNEHELSKRYEIATSGEFSIRNR